MLAYAFARLQQETAQAHTSELFHELNQSFQQIGQKVKQSHSSQLNKINLLCMQSLQEKLDRAHSLYEDYSERKSVGGQEHEGRSQVSPSK